MPPTKAALAARPWACPKCGARGSHIYEGDGYGEWWTCLFCGHTQNVELSPWGPMKQLRRRAESHGIKL